ncbi:hypothetical protein C8R30_106101 [Nitrosomonas nitrosa]|nr:hypothetical protein C8R30_106101 [Nitrosomonas nitrosa]
MCITNARLNQKSLSRKSMFMGVASDLRNDHDLNLPLLCKFGKKHKILQAKTFNHKGFEALLAESKAAILPSHEINNVYG